MISSRSCICVQVSFVAERRILLQSVAFRCILARRLGIMTHRQVSDGALVSGSLVFCRFPLHCLAFCCILARRLAIMSRRQDTDGLLALGRPLSSRWPMPHLALCCLAPS